MFKKVLVATFVLIWLVTAVNPTDRGIWVLENFLVVTIFPVVLWLDRRYRFNDWTFFSLTLFVVLHLLGANTTYNSMPYFVWFTELFGWQRNYYDQVVHALFGLMVFVPFFEVFYHQGLSRRVSYLIAFLFITAIGAWYEILEWIAMALFCEQPAERCSVAITQGDVWDAQKDMAYAGIGALTAYLLHSFRTVKETE
jgi:putative membrane protein